MADDSSNITKRYVNLNDLYKQAYLFSDSSSWYKHIKDSATVYVYLVRPLHTDEQDGGYVTTHSKYNLSICLDWKGMRGIDIPNGVPSSMAELSKKYPVTITPELGSRGDGAPPRVARYMFDRYLFFLKRHGLVPQDATELPPHDRTNPLKLDNSITSNYSMTISSCNFNHEKWRMIGLMVRAACKLATDEGIEIVDTPPYPPNSAAWDYLKNDEQLSLNNED